MPVAGKQTFIIAGAGQAGAWVARTLRSEGFAGRIVMIGAEAHLPYERPPLSKDILSGKCDPAKAALMTETDLSDLRIEFRNSAATKINRSTRTVSCADGSSIRYDHLFLTTGSRPKTLAAQVAPGGPKRLHTLRTMDDAAGLKAALHNSRSLTVIGGGWIGLEVAATARQLGLEVTVIEAASRLCARSLPAVASNYLADLHIRNGIRLILGKAIEDLATDETHAVVRLNGEQIEACHAVIGIGIVPNTELAAAAGLEIDDGIIVDECGRTSDPAISAAGDVTSHPSAFLGRRLRLESWANAQKQAIVAARAALGVEARYAEVPWIWSDQFDVNIQIIGTPELGEIFYRRGDPASGAGCILSRNAKGRLMGAVAFNAPKDLRIVRRAIETASPLDDSLWKPMKHSTINNK